jgi:hypothetical protein
MAGVAPADAAVPEKPPGLATRAYNAVTGILASLFGYGKKSKKGADLGRSKKVSPEAATKEAAAAKKATAAAAAAEEAAAAGKKATKKRAPPMNVEDVRNSIAVFDKMDGNHWAVRSGWRSVLPVPQWHGVVVDDSRVVNLNLSNNALKGAICPQFGAFAMLTALKLDENTITGAIPASLCSLKHLELLDLSYNQLTGPIPPGLFQLPALARVYLQRNLLSGWLPPEACASLVLECLCVEHNKLVGEPPSGWNSTVLTELRLHGNQWTDSKLAKIRIRAELPGTCEVTV